MISVADRVGLLTARDREVVAWLERLVGATVNQIGVRFDLGRTQTYRRLQVLQANGLVRRHRLLVERPTLYAVRGRRIRVGTFDHALAVTELVLAREAAGSRILTDTELHRARGEQRRLGLLPLDDALARTLECERLPDAVEVRPDESLWAYEWEASSKGRSRRLALLTDYAASAYQKVVWIAPDGQLAALIRADVEQMGLSEQMEVRDGIPKDTR
jgi:DNA-binding Lrp family transcriptional regulator